MIVKNTPKMENPSQIVNKCFARSVPVLLCWRVDRSKLCTVLFIRTSYSDMLSGHQVRKIITKREKYQYTHTASALEIFEDIVG